MMLPLELKRATHDLFLIIDATGITFGAALMASATSWRLLTPDGRKVSDTLFATAEQARDWMQELLAKKGSAT